MKKRFDDMSRIERILIVKMLKKQQIDEVIAANDEDRMEVLVTINGVEVDFSWFAEKLEESFDEAVEERAQQIASTSKVDELIDGQNVLSMIDNLIGALERARVEVEDIYGR